MQIKLIKAEARDRLVPNKFQVILIYGALYTLALNIFILTLYLPWLIMPWYGIVLTLAFFALLAPFSYCMTEFYIRAYKGQTVNPFKIFNMGKTNLERSFMLWIVRAGYQLLFTILLIVPGVIYSLNSCMAMYFLRFNPRCTLSQAIQASKKVMKGHRLEYLLLKLSFILWFLMGVGTLGLGFIWVVPYFCQSKATFFKRVLQGDNAAYRDESELAQINAMTSGSNDIEDLRDMASDSHEPEVVVQKAAPAVVVEPEVVQRNEQYNAVAAEPYNAVANEQGNSVANEQGNSVDNEIKSEAKEEIEQEIKDEVKQEVLDDIKQDIKQDIKEELKEIINESEAEAADGADNESENAVAADESAAAENVDSNGDSEAQADNAQPDGNEASEPVKKSIKKPMGEFEREVIEFEAADEENEPKPEADDESKKDEKRVVAKSAKTTKVVETAKERLERLKRELHEKRKS